MTSTDDVRFACRRLAKQPGTTVASVVTLALSIGASVAASSLLSAVLLHPLPVTEPDRLVVVGARRLAVTAQTAAPSPLDNEHIYPLFPAVRSSGVFDQVAAGGNGSNLVTMAGETSSRPLFFASHNFFETLGVRLQAGRGFSATDDRPGAPAVAIVSHRFWQRMFNASRDAIGQSLVVGRTHVTIVGIAPAGFRGLELAEAPDLYLPLHIVQDISGPRVNFFADTTARVSPTAWIRVIGRMKPGMDAAQVSVRLAALPAGPAVDGRTFGVTALNTAALAEAARPGMEQFARLLGITVGLLLVIGCLTVGMLLLLRTEARRDEFAVCLALGATRGRLGLGIILEGALLSGLGAALALPVGWWLVAGVRAFQLPGGIEIAQLEIPMDARLLGAAAAAGVIATLAIALVAGVFGFSADIAGVLRTRAGATPRIGRRRTRAALIVAEIAVAVVLLTGAGLFTRSLIAALSLNPGYETGRIATSTISLGPHGYAPDQATLFFEDLHARVSGSPAIRSMAYMRFVSGMGRGGEIAIDGEPRTVPSLVTFNGIDERYFQAMGLSIVRGRDLTSADRAGAPRVAIVSASLGRFLVHGGDALGHRIGESILRPDAVEVVGVVPDIVTSVTALEPLVVYMPLAQLPATSQRTVVVRASSDAAAAVRETMAALKGMAPGITQPTFTTIDERLARQMSPQRFGATVLGALGAMAALLTLFGVYVLAESMSSLRRREIGVRAALGATRWNLGTLVLTETARLIVVGLVTGLLLAWIGTSLIHSFLFGIQPLDPTTFLVVATAMLALALAVSLRPALRASRVDLASLLREE